MHGVQYENGQGGASIFNEVEAYVFEATIATNSQLDNHSNKFHVNIPASEEGVSTVYEKPLVNYYYGTDILLNQ